MFILSTRAAFFNVPVPLLLMNEECPICLEPRKERVDELLFQCQHTVCPTCAVELFKHQCMTSCPVCRADPKESNQFKVQIVRGERQIFYTDSGHYRVLDEASILGRVRLMRLQNCCLSFMGPLWSVYALWKGSVVRNFSQTTPENKTSIARDSMAAQVSR